MMQRFQKVMSVAVALLLVLALALPAGANSGLELQVNGKAVSGAGLKVKDGITMIDLATLASIHEPELQILQGEFLLIDENKIKLPIVPIVEGEKTYVPLRFVGETLNFRVNWTPGLISLEKEQLKDGMTAMDVLVKSSQKAEAINTYAMTGSFGQKMNAQMEGGGEDFSLDMTSELSGLIQNEPMQVYLKQTVAVPKDMSGEMELDMEMETYIDEEFMYIKMPGQDEWLKQPHFLPMEVLKEQQQVNSDPLRASEQMLEMGMAPSFGKDATIDGRDYYVVKTTIDMQKFMDSQKELLQQIMGSMSGLMDVSISVPAEGMEAVSSVFATIIKEIMENGDFDYQYAMYIDKETFLPNLLDYQMTLKLDLDVLGLLETIREAIDEEIPEEMLGEIPAKVKLDLIQSGKFKMFDFGGEFVKPDVSKVINFADFHPEAPAAREPIPSEPKVN